VRERCFEAAACAAAAASPRGAIILKSVAGISLLQVVPSVYQKGAGPLGVKMKRERLYKAIRFVLRKYNLFRRFSLFMLQFCENLNRPKPFTRRAELLR
jgi:hypothetical protein